MKEIALTRGYVTCVDDEDFDELSRYKWYAGTTSGVPRAVRNSRSKEIGKPHTIFMYRQIMDAPSNMVVHHIDHDTLNNQRKNLRICTIAQHSASQRKQAGRSSRFKGVSWHRMTRKWRAYIKVFGVMRELGLSDDEEEAARAYNKAALEAWGEFALLNDV